MTRPTLQFTRKEKPPTRFLGPKKGSISPERITSNPPREIPLTNVTGTCRTAPDSRSGCDGRDRGARGGRSPREVPAADEPTGDKHSPVGRCDCTGKGDR